MTTNKVIRLVGALLLLLVGAGLARKAAYISLFGIFAAYCIIFVPMRPTAKLSELMRVMLAIAISFAAVYFGLH